MDWSGLVWSIINDHRNTRTPHSVCTGLIQSYKVLNEDTTACSPPFRTVQHFAMAASPLTLPDIASLSSAPDSTLTTALDLLFEPTQDLRALVIPTMRSITFASYAQLIDTIRDQLLTIQSAVHPDPTGRQPLLNILGSHPRLGQKKVDSAQSAAEQAQLRRDGNSNEAGGGEDELAMVNQEYEERFPGLRYVVFVNGRGREEIMRNMRERIDRGDVVLEEREAIEVGFRSLDTAQPSLGRVQRLPWTAG